jgi:hypothetical protein
MFNRVRRMIDAELRSRGSILAQSSGCEAREHQAIVKDEADVIGGQHWA